MRRFSQIFRLFAGGGSVPAGSLLSGGAQRRPYSLFRTLRTAVLPLSLIFSQASIQEASAFFAPPPTSRPVENDGFLPADARAAKFYELPAAHVSTKSIEPEKIEKPQAPVRPVSRTLEEHIRNGDYDRAASALRDPNLVLTPARVAALGDDLSHPARGTSLFRLLLKRACEDPALVGEVKPEWLEAVASKVVAQQESYELEEFRKVLYGHPDLLKKFEKSQEQEEIKRGIKTADPGPSEDLHAPSQIDWGSAPLDSVSLEALSDEDLRGCIAAGRVWDVVDYHARRGELQEASEFLGRLHAHAGPLEVPSAEWVCNKVEAGLRKDPAAVGSFLQALGNLAPSPGWQAPVHDLIEHRCGIEAHTAMEAGDLAGKIMENPAMFDRYADEIMAGWNHSRHIGPAGNEKTLSPESGVGATVSREFENLLDKRDCATVKKFLTALTAQARFNADRDENVQAAVRQVLTRRLTRVAEDLSKKNNKEKTCLQKKRSFLPDPRKKYAVEYILGNTSLFATFPPDRIRKLNIRLGRDINDLINLDMSPRCAGTFIVQHIENPLFRSSVFPDTIRKIFFKGIDYGFCAEAIDILKAVAPHETLRAAIVPEHLRILAKEIAYDALIRPDPLYAERLKELKEIANTTAVPAWQEALAEGLRHGAAARMGYAGMSIAKGMDVGEVLALLDKNLSDADPCVPQRPENNFGYENEIFYLAKMIMSGTAKKNRDAGESSPPDQTRAFLAQFAAITERVGIDAAYSIQCALTEYSQTHGASDRRDPAKAPPAFVPVLAAA